MHTHTWSCAYIDTYTHTCTYTYAYIDTHAYIDTYIDTYACTYTRYLDSGQAHQGPLLPQGDQALVLYFTEVD